MLEPFKNFLFFNRFISLREWRNGRRAGLRNGSDRFCCVMYCHVSEKTRAFQLAEAMSDHLVAAQSGHSVGTHQHRLRGA
jgi:hypothetical protein